MKKFKIISTPEEHSEFFEHGDAIYISTSHITVDGISGQKRVGPSATVTARFMIETFPDESTSGGTSRMSFSGTTICETCWFVHGVISCWNMGEHKPVKREEHI